MRDPPEELETVVADARAQRFKGDRIETLWGNEYLFRLREDGRLQVWEWYGDEGEGPERSFGTTFTLEGRDDEDVLADIVSEYAWHL